ncbi:DUF4150 domain-containing protein [Myxococcus sp. CA056]|uniref:DUF4150 domain-containing protein n=1 Tax=unclassified Myxococcus TaxID=2648731 RepID=UPI00157B9A62|nr:MULTISPECIES: DUF4150 domain-containing protein [unclassified Myxococcus]NTX10177.1 DUF4150 domain-containing protein [Myxococcus sp. CA056]NTX41501.1 DUF4150 domain-containing protein [Myxococcus sp. CA033]NTX51028.1 DUF4150 domain-containing protein [Myxococcus sp. CA039A]
MAKVSVNAPKTPVTEGSSGVAAATLPNVCKMPGPPAPFVPTPLPNIGKSGSQTKGYSTSVTIEGKKVAIRGATFGSMGDVASQGTGGGMVSSNVEGPTSFVGPGSMDVKIEGKNVQLLGDPMFNNCGPRGSPANSATLMGVIQVSGWLLTLVTGEENCPLCDEKHSSAGALKETDATREDAKTLAKALTKNNQGPDQSRKFPSPRMDTGRMLGVVQCMCNQKYADHSSRTEKVFREIVTDELHWHAPADGGLDISIARKNAETGQSENIKLRKVQAFAQRFCEKNGLDPNRVDAAWNRAAGLHEKWLRTSTPPACYPPGSCAGPKALALALDAGAKVSGLTERWFHSANQRTDGEVEYLRSDRTEPVLGSFGHGESVPPCGTCNIILPLMLCTKGKTEDEECRHEKKKR